MAKTNSNVKKQKITKDMTIGDIVQKHPHSIRVMMEHGLHCIGCHVASWETLEQGAAGHGIDINSLLTDLNKKEADA